ncbi:MAG: hypothetical protein KJI69_05020 [Patescibacteria group bacterium]|nr:hypothetical protein [Patescibacteria group bacterium]
MGEKITFLYWILFGIIIGAIGVFAMTFPDKDKSEIPLIAKKEECREWGGNFMISYEYRVQKEDGYRVYCWKDNVETLFDFEF